MRDNLMWRTVLLLGVFERIHDVRLVRPLRYPFAAAFARDSCELDDRASRICACRFRQIGWVTANSAGFS